MPGLLMTASILVCAAVASSGAVAGGDPAVERGRNAIEKHGCAVCHRIPGIASPGGGIGPPLAGIARRAYIAGTLPNDPDNLRRWIAHPQEVKPGTAMPDTGVTTQEASDIANYLYVRG